MATTRTRRPPAMNLIHQPQAHSLLRAQQPIARGTNPDQHLGNRLQANPLREQPRLVFNSAFQPFVLRWSPVRINRHLMAAGAPFLGRFMTVGGIQAIFRERAHMDGTPVATGVAHQVPSFISAPVRMIRIGQPVNPQGGGRRR